MKGKLILGLILVISMISCQRKEVDEDMAYELAIKIFQLDGDEEERLIRAILIDEFYEFNTYEELIQLLVEKKELTGRFIKCELVNVEVIDRYWKHQDIQYKLKYNVEYELTNTKEEVLINDRYDGRKGVFRYDIETVSE
jgi:hypothetical protein